jgi:hypothetical protein
MDLYQPHTSGYQQGPSAPQPIANHMDQQGGYQQQVPVQPQLVQQIQPPVQQLQPVIQQQDNSLQSIDWASKIADVMRNQFGLKPKEPTHIYWQPYPEAYDQITLPHHYQVLDFTKFSGRIM